MLFTKDVWEKLSANQKDNLKNDLIVKEAKKDWKSSFTDAKYQKLEAKIKLNLDKTYEKTN